MLLQCFYGVPELRSAVASYALAPTRGDGPAPGHRWAAGLHTSCTPARHQTGLPDGCQDILTQSP